MMGMRMPKTCWAVFKWQVINLRICCIWLVDSVESVNTLAKSWILILPRSLCNTFLTLSPHCTFWFTKRQIFCLETQLSSCMLSVPRFNYSLQHYKHWLSGRWSSRQNTIPTLYLLMHLQNRNMEVMCTYEVETTLMNIIHTKKKLTTCCSMGLKHSIISGQYNMILTCATPLSYSVIWYRILKLYVHCAKYYPMFMINNEPVEYYKHIYWW